MEPPHSGIELARKVHECLTDWEIDNRTFSITLDNASVNDNMQDILKERLSLQDDFKLVSNGEFFHVRCCAHILNLIVQEGLKVTSSALHKIRESIKFVKASEARSILFKQCVEQVGSINTSIGLRLDVPTRWNSTYTMLESGIKYHRAFAHMAINDTNYKFGLTNDEWARADAMCSFLRPFEKITSPNLVIQEMARKMKQKFDKYWNEYSIILALAVVFDPRWKFNIIQYCYTKIDPITCYEKVANIKSNYKASTVTTHHSALASSVSTSASFDDAFDDYQDIYAIMDHSSLDKSELENYLEEPILKPDSWKELDVLNWWKSNQHRYPILSRMAADILSIPITTVASESAFSIGSRALTKYRSSILPASVQAIICVRNWLHGFVYNDNKGEEEEESLDIFAPDEPAISGSQSNFVELDDSEEEEDNDDATNI
ncbi:zinc finger BED domain-containing protein RICESLEEPER 2-like [Prosopis cineraria]|uniref:zinc finger BED domain-containing protein RICESLEEPER 2-like n=1 Tax=Prosopis cineraria TaxID=364024 RepID=UPI0024103747|nr:zinc finger BED domain-containing protein RICESLEEPER 2-like [Prosopis cineraria]